MNLFLSELCLHINLQEELKKLIPDIINNLVIHKMII